MLATYKVDVLGNGSETFTVKAASERAAHAHAVESYRRRHKLPNTTMLHAFTANATVKAVTK